MKVCTKCREEKSLDEFHKCSYKKDGHNYWCKECIKKYTNKKKKRKYNRKYREINKQKIKEYNKKYRKENREKRRIYQLKFREENADWCKKYNNAVERRLHHNISTYINRSLRNGKEGKSWTLLVDYDLKELKKHLESRFKNGMCWDNRGEWQIDHIIPISVFKFESPKDEEFKMCWSLNNLQPMFAFENDSKNDKLDYYSNSKYKELGVYHILEYIKNKER